MSEYGMNSGIGAGDVGGAAASIPRNCET